MTEEIPLIRQRMRTPRAAAFAGIVFSLLTITSHLLIWFSIPSNPLGPTTVVITHSKNISLALNLLSFAGIAFLWFIGVVRDRLGKLEDQFFSTIFLGSGLLYVAMIFAASAVAGGMLTVLGKGMKDLLASGAYALGREHIQAVHVYATKMAGVFMISTSTITLQTRIAPRWMAFVGYALAAILLLSFESIVWVSLAFPLWVFLFSLCILVENLGQGFARGADSLQK
jgi:hypothetical protein